MIGHRFECQSSPSVLCDRGPGKPSRKTCRYCGAALRVTRGLWGVFTWNPENRYFRADAVGLYASHGLAEKVASRANKVVRFVPEDPQ